MSTSLLFYLLISLNEAPAVVDPRDARRLFLSSFAAYFFSSLQKSEVKGNGGRASLRNNRASRDRASRGKIF